MKNSIKLILFLVILTRFSLESQIQNTNTQVTLLWNAPTKNIDGSDFTSPIKYRVYYGENRYTNFKDAGQSTNLIINGLTQGIIYHFAVTTINNLGAESQLSKDMIWINNLDPLIINTSFNITTNIYWNNQIYTLLYNCKMDKK